MWRLGKQAFVGRRKYDSPKNDSVGGYGLYRKKLTRTQMRRLIYSSLPPYLVPRSEAAFPYVSTNEVRPLG